MNKDKQKISIQERCENKALDAYGEIEGQIDIFLTTPYGNDWRCLQYLNTLAFSPMVIKYMQGQVDDIILEVENKEKCDQLKEAYNFLSVDDKKLFVKFLQNIDNDITTYITNNKTVRKVKLKTPEQMVKKLPYLESWENHTSINPIEIPRAKMLFTYNTCSRKVTCFEGNLSVNGSRITGYESCTEKTLTDHEFLGKIETGGMIIAKRFMDEIPRSKLKDGNDLMTKNTLLIRVIK